MQNPDEVTQVLAFVSAVAYGVRRDHPAVVAAHGDLERFAADCVDVAGMGATIQQLADRALEAACAAGDARAVAALLAIGAGRIPTGGMTSADVGYRMAIRNGHADVAAHLQSSGLLPASCV